MRAGDFVQDIADRLLEGVQLIGRDFTCLYINDAAARQARTTKEQRIGRHVMEIYPGIEKTPLFSMLQECMEQRRSQWVDRQLTYPDGQNAWFELRLEPTEQGVIVLSIEITEKRQVEEALRRSTRALTTLSAVNQALVRATDERQFMQDVCNVAVERGAYRMAWIGIKEADEARSIRPMASAGADAGYTESLRLTWDDSPRGRGPTGRAVRTGEVVVAHVIASEPDFEPWRREAIARGYASSIALPIRIADAVAGAISLYAAEPGAFDPDEVELLAELARDLGHGIQTLRERDAARCAALNQLSAEQALLASNERFHAFMEASPALAWVKDDAGRFLYLNGAWERTVGARAHDWIGKRTVDLFPAAEAAQLLEHDRQAVSTGKPVEVLEETSALGGRPRRWSTVRFPFTSASGQPLLGGIAIDITDHLRAQDDVTRLNARLERLTRAAQELSRALVPSTISGIVTRTVRELLTADAATFVLRDGDQCRYVDEDAAEPLWKGQAFASTGSISGWVMDQREAVAIEDLHTDPRIRPELDAHTAVRSLAMVPIRREDPMGAIGVYWAKHYQATPDDLDILQALADSASVALERAHMVAELRVSEDRYRGLVENLEDVVYVVDPEGRVQYISPAIRKYNYTPDEIIGQLFARYVHPDDVEDLRESVVRTLAGHVETQVFRVYDKQRGLHFVRSASGAVLREGRVVAVSGVLIDITELKRTEDQLRHAQKMEAIGQLAGGVAHDFNNLLSVILSYSTFISEAIADTDPVQADIDEVRRAATRAAELTRQLLAFSRKQVLEPRILDLNQLASGLEKMLQRVIGEDIELVQVLKPNLGRVKADPGQLEQVIMNLVVNARDAMPRGGKLTIETSQREIDAQGAAPSLPLQPGPYVLLAVSDTGCGMDEPTQQHLFEPFFTTKEVGKGTGLGLSTVYGIVEQSGGRISVRSEVGRGTTFEIYLPAVAEVSDTRRRTHDSERPPIGTETILLVEDDQAVRALATRILRAAGYTVLAAASGSEALRTFEAHTSEIALLLTDVVMPQMSGKQLADQLTEQRPGLQVLFMSGYTDSAIQRHGELEPGTMFIGKPFHARELTRKVRDVLDAGTV